MPAPRPLPVATFGLRAVAAALVALAAALLVALPPAGEVPGAGAQEPDACEAIDLGTLVAEDELLAFASWTGADCDSAFLPNSDAQSYRFELAEAGLVRIDLTSPDGGDSYLHLLAEDGSVLTHNDDGGFALDARIETRLAAGVYHVEAAQGSGRARGGAGFELSIVHLGSCGPLDLGVLEAGEGFTVESAWSFGDCSARFRPDAPAKLYRFELPEAGLVRIDLMTPEESDAFLYLLTADGGYLHEDDDDGVDRNARIENELPAGAYLVDATTWVDRDHGHALTDFTLTIRLVSPDSFRIKAEAIHIPDQLIAGQPFTVDYRVGNLGQLDVPGMYSVIVLTAAPGDFTRTGFLRAGGDRWRAGVSYHSAAATQGATSLPLTGARPLQLVLDEPGHTWVVLAAGVYDEEFTEYSFHRLEVEAVVLSSLPYGPVTVAVGGVDYVVSAAADEEGLVTTSVSPAAAADGEVDAAQGARATYAAGVLTQLLDGIFERAGLAPLTAAGEAAPAGVARPSSSALARAFAELYTGQTEASGIAGSLADGRVVNPVAVEDVVIGAADAAAAQYAAASASWRALLERIPEGAPLAFEEALAVHAELSYAERVLAPLASAKEIVLAARAAEDGWLDPAVRARTFGLAAGAACGGGEEALGAALGAAGVDGVDAALALERELRAALPVHGFAVDGALCGAAAVDADNARFLQLLALAGSSEVAGLLAPEAPPAVVPPPPAPERLRIVARLADDGRTEHGVELTSGELVLPVRRFLSADVRAGEWHISSDVELGGASLGTVRARRLASGGIELGFRGAEGEAIVPAIRYLPAELVPGVWFRSSEIEVPAPLADGEDG